MYEGQFSRGKKHGKGKFVLASGKIYEGDWVNSMPHGLVNEVDPDGDTFEGQYVEGKREGPGKLTFASGKVYEGNFEDNFPNGQGKLTIPGDAEYEGIFRISGED